MHESAAPRMFPSVWPLDGRTHLRRDCESVFACPELISNEGSPESQPYAMTASLRACHQGIDAS